MEHAVHGVVHGWVVASERGQRCRECKGGAREYVSFSSTSFRACGVCVERVVLTDIKCTTIISLAAQMYAEYDSAWYGTFKVTLDTPVPTSNSAYWPPDIYKTYDPNWREFIG